MDAERLYGPEPATVSLRHTSAPGSESVSVLQLATCHERFARSGAPSATRSKFTCPVPVTEGTERATVFVVGLYETGAQAPGATGTPGASHTPTVGLSSAWRTAARVPGFDRSRPQASPSTSSASNGSLGPTMHTERVLSYG